MSATPQFATPAVLKHVLERRVRAYLAGIRPTDSPVMYAKAVGLVAAAALSYAGLVFWSVSLGSALAFGLVLAMSVVGIGFNVQHDGNHGGFSKYAWVNRTAGFTLDLIGASSYYWKVKHNHNHHVYTNIPHEDGDINLGPLARLSGDHRWLWFHRFQHIYLWGLYAFVHTKYLFSDLARFMRIRRDSISDNFPKGWDLVGFVGGKLLFLTVAFALPMTRHSVLAVLAGYLLISMTMGIVFSVVFQLAHTVDTVEHPVSGSTGGDEWVVHQIQTTANFAPQNRVLTFLVGGLNFQREHHLFPKISHVHYPKIARIVRAVCREHRIEVRESPSIWAAMRSHYRFVKAMGAKP